MLQMPIKQGKYKNYINIHRAFNILVNLYDELYKTTSNGSIK